ncbi:4-hydroxy-3-methylbut-2-enyl diphosphate reductase [Bailinhaonella thermotolerans]|uniref:4-hydroxy-3-methylbut-2-enyl diphosphate reductase n=1 Tax=Bailinhaonella thermotolerans TaxID=1070861 RepID=UPI002413C914|nr:4-hydroxy-3-methylbut-2-enyl diphosphate reductase [Bailinhaonella thermotolerans]
MPTPDGARTVLLASPRSLCAGVERAIETVELALANRPDPTRPIYVRKQIVHNTHVVADLEERGAVFVDELGDIPADAPPGTVVVFSAHGVSPAVRRDADARGFTVIDATCPLVTKVHAEARRFAGRGDTVVLIGHAGHEEVEGTLGEAPDRTLLLEDAAGVDDLPIGDGEPVSYLTQTTLALDETAEIVEALRARFPNLRGPAGEDICYATTNRQRAVEQVARESDVVLVVGSGNSSNSRRMVEVARRQGTPAHLIDDAGRIDPEWLRGASVIGLSAGASAPQRLVDEVIDRLRAEGPVRVLEREVTTEDVSFALPKEVRPGSRRAPARPPAAESPAVRRERAAEPPGPALRSEEPGRVAVPRPRMWNDEPEPGAREPEEGSRGAAEGARGPEETARSREEEARSPHTGTASLVPRHTPAGPEESGMPRYSPWSRDPERREPPGHAHSPWESGGPEPA